MALAWGVAAERAKECSIAPDLKRNAPTKESAATNAIHLVTGALGDVDRDGATAELLRGGSGMDADPTLGFPWDFGKGATTRS